MSKLLVIVGPTASGKSALGLKLAETFDGEIINADSRAVYRYMDIGTAKPTKSDMLLIPHHLIGIKNPNEAYSAAEFKRDCLAAITDISDRGKFPIIIGGTGLYIDSVLFNYQFPSGDNKELRVKNEALSLDELVQKLKSIDPEASETVDLKNPRRVMRAIETAGLTRSKSEKMRPDTLVLGLVLSKLSIQKRISIRIQKMLSEGLIDEVRAVGEKFGWDDEAMTGPAYRSFRGVVDGSKSIDEAAKEFARRDWLLAKRQITWFKRNPAIYWLDADDPELLLAAAKKQVLDFVSN